MCKLDIYGGLLGSGKTTLIRKMLTDTYQGYRIAVIENEIGRVNLDAQEFTGIQVRPLTAGCVCCTLQGDMMEAVKELVQTVNPDYIVMEATGAADLQIIREICCHVSEVQVNRCIMLVNAKKLQTLLKVIGEFYHVQIRQAETVYLNFTEELSEKTIQAVKETIHEINPNAQIVAVPLSEITKDTFPEPEEIQRKQGNTSENLPEYKWQSKRNPAFKITDVSDRPLRIHPLKTEEETLYTWTCKVEKPVTEEQLALFWMRVRKEEIWRVKGIVSMEDGTIRKLDYTFGDVFETEKDLETVSVLNQIVFIGKKYRRILLQPEI